MNKLEFNGKEIFDFDKANTAIDSISDIEDELETRVFSNDVKEIRIVNEYPVEEEDGVLYIKVSSQE